MPEYILKKLCVTITSLKRAWKQHMRNAFITGITGQDGVFLAEHLLMKGYHVTGFSRTNTIASHLTDKIHMLVGDISNEADVTAAIERTMPDEIYNLASQSRPGESWTKAPQTLCANGLGAVYLFEAVRSICPTARICHASSSELFGQAKSTPQNEDTPFNPCNPYAASKLYAHQMARIYRNSHHLFISSAILFNHESEHRPLHFVTQKIAYGAACAGLGILNSPELNEEGCPIVSQGKLALGNLETARDWGYAPDFVQAMWLMLQQEKPDDFVIGTGKLHTLKQLCEIAYQHVGKDWKEYVFSDPAFIRPLETTQALADATKAHRLLGWEPSMSFQAMIKNMVDAQTKRLRDALI